MTHEAFPVNGQPSWSHHCCSALAWKKTDCLLRAALCLFRAWLGNAGATASQQQPCGHGTVLTARGHPGGLSHDSGQFGGHDRKWLFFLPMCLNKESRCPVSLCRSQLRVPAGSQCPASPVTGATWLSCRQLPRTCFQRAGQRKKRQKLPLVLCALPGYPSLPWPALRLPRPLCKKLSLDVGATVQSRWEEGPGWVRSTILGGTWGRGCCSGIHVQQHLQRV